MKKFIILLLMILCCSCVVETYDISAPPKIIAPAPAPYIYRIYPNTGSPYYSPYFYHQPKPPYVYSQPRHQPQPNPRPSNPSHNHPGGNHPGGNHPGGNHPGGNHPGGNHTYGHR